MSMSETISLTSGSQNFKRRSPGPVSERKTEGNVLCPPSSARGNRLSLSEYSPLPLMEEWGAYCPCFSGLFLVSREQLLPVPCTSSFPPWLQPSAYSHQSFSKLSADLPTVDLRQYNETHKADERPTLLPHLLLWLQEAHILEVRYLSNPSASCYLCYG